MPIYPCFAGVRRSIAIGLLAFAATLPAEAAETAAVTRPILLELFTSQGCSSCPPADAVLRELGTRPDVLPLAFHVDYWDYLGWADPFARHEFTARQQQYSGRRGFQVYTPQLVLDGRSAVVGSQRGAVESGIANVRRDLRAVESSIAREGASATITIDTATDADAAGDIWLLSFDPEQSTEIKRGENAGRSIVYCNIVRSIRSLGRWNNKALAIKEFLRPEERGARLALVVQDRSGEIWAVAASP